MSCGKSPAPIIAANKIMATITITAKERWQLEAGAFTRFLQRLDHDPDRAPDHDRAPDPDPDRDHDPDHDHDPDPDRDQSQAVLKTA